MRIALLVLLMLVLAGCGASPAGTTPDATAPATDATAPVVTTPVPDVTSPAATTPATGSDDLPVGSVEAKAVDMLVQELGVDAGTLQLTGKEPVEWSDGSLGCPVEGMMYTQAIVPGYRLTYSDGTSTYNVHTDEDGSRVLLCQAGNPVDLGTR